MRAALVATAVVGSLLLAGCGEQTGAAPGADPSPAPAPAITVDGRPIPYVRAEPVSDASVPDRASRSLTVFAIGRESGGGPCGPPVTRLLVRESADEVRVLAAAYERPRDGDLICPAIAYGPTPRQVRLARPLGERRLVDARNGKALEVLDLSALPTLDGVPDGFSESPPQRSGYRPTVVDRTWTDSKERRIRLRIGPRDSLEGEDAPCGVRAADTIVAGAPAVVFRDACGGPGSYSVALQPTASLAARVEVDANPGRWDLRRVIALARSIRRYAPVEGGLPIPAVAGSQMALFRGTGPKPLRTTVFFKSSDILAAVDCRGTGGVTVRVDGRSRTFRCTDRPTHHPLRVRVSPRDPFPVRVDATEGVEWAMSMARGTLDGS